MFASYFHKIIKALIKQQNLWTTGSSAALLCVLMTQPPLIVTTLAPFSPRLLCFVFSGSRPFFPPRNSRVQQMSKWMGWYYNLPTANVNRNKLMISIISGCRSFLLVHKIWQTTFVRELISQKPTFSMVCTAEQTGINNMSREILE